MPTHESRVVIPKPNENSAARWNSKVVLVARVGKGIVGVDVPVMVKEIAFYGKVRIQLELMPTLPLVRVLQVTFLETPKIDFVLKPLKSFDMMDLPGLNQFLFGIINDALKQNVVDPNRITIDLAKGSNAGLKAIGVLKVIVFQTRGLKLASNAEPHVKISVSGRTRAITRALQSSETAWNSVHYILVGSLKDSLGLALATGKDNKVGACKFDLARLEEGSVGEEFLSQWSNLTNPAGKIKGELQFGIEYVPAETAESSTPTTPDETTPTLQEDIRTGILSLTLTQAQDFLEGEKSGGKRELANVFYELWIHPRNRIIANDEPQPENWDPHYYRSTVMKRTASPNWEESIEFFIENTKRACLTVMLRDAKNEDLVYGRWTGTVASVVGQSDWIRFEQADSAKFFLRSSIKHVPIDVDDSAMLENAAIGVVRIKVQSASGLNIGASLTGLGRTALYVQGECSGREVGMTKRAKDPENPTWNNSIFALIHDPTESLHLTIFNEQFGSDLMVGRTVLDVSHLFDHDGMEIEKNEGLRDESRKAIEGSKLRFNACFFSAKPYEPPVKVDEDAEALVVPEEINVAESNCGLMVLKEIRVRHAKDAGKSRVYCELYLDDDYWAKTRMSLFPATAENTWAQFVETFIRCSELVNIRCLVKETKTLGSDQIVGSFSIPLRQLYRNRWYKLQGTQQGEIQLRVDYSPIMTHVEPEVRDWGMLAVEVIEADELIAVDAGGTSDPFCIGKLNGERIFKSRVVKKSLQPKWNETFEAYVKDRSDAVLQMELRDWNRLQGSEPLGFCNMDLSSLDPNIWHEFVEKLDTVSSGTIHFRLKFTPNQKPAALGAVVGAGGKVLGTGADIVTGAGSMVMGAGGKVLGAGGKVLGTGAGAVAGAGSAVVGVGASALGKLGFKKKEVAGDLNLTINILSATDLIAVDAGGTSDPYVEVIHNGKVVHKTAVQKKTLTPSWNETFVVPIIDLGRDQIALSLCDWNRFKKDEALGKVNIKLADLVKGKWTELNCKLEGAAKGSLKIKVKLDERSPGKSGHVVIPIVGDPAPTLTLGQTGATVKLGSLTIVQGKMDPYEARLKVKNAAIKDAPVIFKTKAVKSTAAGACRFDESFVIDPKAGNPTRLTVEVKWDAKSTPAEPSCQLDLGRYVAKPVWQEIKLPLQLQGGIKAQLSVFVFAQGMQPTPAASAPTTPTKTTPTK